MPIGVWLLYFNRVLRYISTSNFEEKNNDHCVEDGEWGTEAVATNADVQEMTEKAERKKAEREARKRDNARRNKNFKVTL